MPSTAVPLSAEARSDLPSEPLKILVADDDLDCRETLEAAVVELGHTCETARDGAEAWAKYEAEGADLILSDWEMPRMDGLELCRKVRADDSWRTYTHFIFVTGANDRAHFIDGMRAGADDYVSKPVDVGELEARLVAARRVILLQRKLRERNSLLRMESERARMEARTDSLTLAFNRLALEEDLEALAARVARYGHGYCAALCDVDHFKAYNDSFGHLAGDDVLRMICHRIRGELRRGDVLYRYGGEEFLVILPEQSLEEATIGVDRVRKAIEALGIPHAPVAGPGPVTISAGISILEDATNDSTAAWLKRADEALYVAKGKGRNCVVVEGEK